MRELIVNADARVQRSGRQGRPDWIGGLTGPVCQALDLVSLSAAFPAVLLMPGLRRNGYSFRQLFHTRLPLRVMLLLVLCVCTWRMILVSTGIYSKQRKGGLDYCVRWLIGLNSCAFVVGLVMVVVPSRLNAWKVLEAFWLASFVLMGGLRALAVLTHHFLRPRGVS